MSRHGRGGLRKRHYRKVALHQAAFLGGKIRLSTERGLEGWVLCPLCKMPVALMEGSMDHILPRALGGTDRLPNLQITHWHCNQKKGDKYDPEPGQCFSGGDSHAISPLIVSHRAETRP
jgi:5-methylcytosine-specific restriction endonuclease McrA